MGAHPQLEARLTEKVSKRHANMMTVQIYELFFAFWRLFCSEGVLFSAASYMQESTRQSGFPTTSHPTNVNPIGQEELHRIFSRRRFFEVC